MELLLIFGKESWTENTRTTKVAENRKLLSHLLSQHNFTNYPREWWHFTYKVAIDAPVYDIEIE